jgi:hypothetical protein
VYRTSALSALISTANKVNKDTRVVLTDILGIAVVVQSVVHHAYVIRTAVGTITEEARRRPSNRNSTRKLC